MKWSFQLYSARFAQPWEGVVRMLARTGYDEVEGFGGVYEDASAFRALLDINGLSMPTGHFPIDLLEKDFGEAERTARTLGIRLIACPYLVAEQRPKDAAGWLAFGKRLAAVGRTARDAGFGFAWHNHDFEFAALPDGSVPMTHILDGAPEIGWEMDVAWIIRGGADPMPWIERHGRRVLAVHVKDIARPGEKPDEDGWEDVGHGTVDWKTLFYALRDNSPAEHFIMEHDKPSDAERFARRSIETVRNF
jgi:sugar phosphate isomerase/epimerase